MRRYFALTVFVMLTLSACSPVVETEFSASPENPTGTPKIVTATDLPEQDKSAAAPTSEAAAEDRSLIYIQSSKIIAGDPKGSAALWIEGDLPTPCHKLGYAVNKPDAENRVMVEVYSIDQPGKMCAQVLVHFEETIPLTRLADGRYSLVLNGEKAAEFEIPYP